MAFNFGGGKTSANQTTETASGQGVIVGGRTQYTAPGSISVGARGVYNEAGALFSGANLKGYTGNLTLNITDAPPGNGLPGIVNNPTPGSVTPSTSATSGVDWKKILIPLAIIAALFVAYRFLRR